MASSRSALRSESAEIGSPEVIKSSRHLTLNDLEMVKTIGAGTFSRVYLCRNQSNNYYALKILAMHDIIRMKQVDHVKNEKNILKEIHHPFLIDLEWSNKDQSFLFLLFPYISGGELFSYLRSAGRFDAATSLFYTVELVSSLEYLHSLSIIYRDLKPENLLLDQEGHLKITDFGFAKKVADKTWTLCGTPEYLAPEIILGNGHDKAVDWWALGVLIYEMLAGYPPFYDDNPFGIFKKILDGKVVWPIQIDPIAKDLIKNLLVLDRLKRLGNLKNGAEDVKCHRLFKLIDWQHVYLKKLKPPIVPSVSFEGDSKNYDNYEETDWRKAPAVSEWEQNLFDDF